MATVVAWSAAYEHADADETSPPHSHYGMLCIWPTTKPTVTWHIPQLPVQQADGSHVFIELPIEAHSSIVKDLVTPLPGTPPYNNRDFSSWVGIWVYTDGGATKEYDKKWTPTHSVTCDEHSGSISVQSQGKPPNFFIHQVRIGNVDVTINTIQYATNNSGNLSMQSIIELNSYVYFNEFTQEVTEVNYVQGTHKAEVNTIFAKKKKD